MQKLFKNKTILITGGTGSFGQKFTERILKHNPKKIIIYSRGEFLQYQMEKKFNDDRLRFFIGDVRESERLWRACDGVDYIIHAAALKHVPICEYNPIEAINTNVLGAVNVINIALDRKVKKVVALSTDKAVNPINLYGASKLCSDKLFISGNSYSGKTGTKFSVVRYGNVAESRGSIIPYFRELKEQGQTCLPLTDTGMTRFFITLDQGVNLVFKAFDIMKGGEIFVSKIPSFRIIDLIKTFNCDYRFIGMRPGEKLHEVMINSEDSRNTYEYKEYYIIYSDCDWFDLKSHFHKGGIKVKDGFIYSSDKNDNWIFK